MPKYQKAGTGIRLLDDLMGASPVPGAAPPTPQMRAATAYETYVQPAVLGLKNAAETLFDPTDPTQLIPSPLGMVASKATKPIRSAVGGIADSAVDGLKRMLRESGNVDRLTDARRTFDPTTMQAVEQFAERNPRIFNRLSTGPLPADKARTARGDFTSLLYEKGDDLGSYGHVRLRPAETVDAGLQTLEHEARHAMDARRLGTTAYDKTVRAEHPTPYHQRPMEVAAKDLELTRAAQRQATRERGRSLTGRERVQLRDDVLFGRGRAPEPTLDMWTGHLPQPDLSRIR